jgi:hypothetical protein
MLIDLPQGDLSKVSSCFGMLGPSCAIEREMKGCSQHDLVGFVANGDPYALADVSLRVVGCYLAQCG